MKQLLKRVLPASINSRVSRAAWQQLNPTWRLPSGLVVEVRSIAEWVIYNDIFVDGEYDAPIEMVLESEQEPLVLDMGANVGYFSLRFADRWFRQKGLESKPTIIGFEGSPATYTELVRRMDQPTLEGSFRSYSGLVGKRTGSGHISTTPFHVTDALVADSSFFASEVPFIDVDSVVPATKRISLLKCDIEGAEEMFIENYPDLLKRVDAAVFELHGNKCNVSRCFDLLKRAGLEHSRNVRTYDEIRVDVFKASGRN